MLNRLRSLLRVLLSRREFEQSMAEEMQLHIEEYADDLVRSGVPREQAVRQARLEFGARNTIEQECRRARGLPRVR